MNKGCLGIGIGALVIAALIGFWGVSQHNSLVGADEGVIKAWADVESSYQRRYDLIDNLVATVKNAAEFEKGTLTEVIEARANAQSIKLSVDDLSAENLQKFQQAQQELNQSFLGRMNFLQENYPQLTATQQFRDLSNSIEQTENRINVARVRFNEEVQTYNTKIRSFPANFIAGFMGLTRKAPFEADKGAEKAPSVRDAFDQ